MHKIVILSLAAFGLAGIVPSALAEESSVHAANDSSYSTGDTPRVNVSGGPSVDRGQLSESDVGGSDYAVTAQGVSAPKRNAAPSNCDGPASFCSIYFGS